MCIYSKRLFEEWCKYEKIVLAVDYDDTLFPWDTFKNSRDRERTIRLVLKAQKLGAYIVIFTASDKERYDEIIKYCKNLGIVVDAINQNPIDLPYGNSGKIFYNHNLCDKSGLRGAIKILKKASTKYKFYKNRRILTN